MPRTQFEGRSAAEAAIKACEELGLTRSEIRYQVVSETGEGIDRRVVIAVEAGVAPLPSATSEPAREREREPRRDEGRGRDRDRGGRGGRDRGERSARGRDDRGGRRGDRGDRGGDRGRRGVRGGRGHEPEADDGIEPLLKLDELPATATPRAELAGQVSERATQAKTVLNEVLKRMGFRAVGVVVQDDAEEIHLDISGDDARRIIGKKGEPLLSLQFLVNRMVSRGEEGGDQVVVLDVAGYRERRRTALADLAKRLAARALEEHKVVKLSPMSAHDRRVFHLTLTQIEGVTTQSEGEGLFRRLLIIPSEFAGRAD